MHVTINAFHLTDETLNNFLDTIITLLQSLIFRIDMIDAFFLYARRILLASKDFRLSFFLVVQTYENNKGLNAKGESNDTLSIIE